MYRLSWVVHVRSYAYTGHKARTVGNGLCADPHAALSTNGACSAHDWRIREQFSGRTSQGCSSPAQKLWVCDRNACPEDGARLSTLGALQAVSSRLTAAALPLAFLAVAPVVPRVSRAAVCSPTLDHEHIAGAGEALGGSSRRCKLVRSVGILIAHRGHVECERLLDSRHGRRRGRLGLRCQCAFDRGTQEAVGAPVATIGVCEALACRRALSA